MTETLKVSGYLTKKDVKRLTTTVRTGTVGPTTVYYAGLTAPIISAGITIITRGQLVQAGLSTYWLWLLSALIAAMAGISWYLIFMRWSYRQTPGRAEELSSGTEIEMTDVALIVRRGYVESTIRWPAISELRRGRSFLAVMIDGNPSLLVPDHWFGSDKKQRIAFHELLEARTNL